MHVATHKEQHQFVITDIIDIALETQEIQWELVYMLTVLFTIQFTMVMWQIYIYFGERTLRFWWLCGE